MFIFKFLMLLIGIIATGGNIAMLLVQSDLVLLVAHGLSAIAAAYGCKLVNDDLVNN